MSRDYSEIYNLNSLKSGVINNSSSVRTVLDS